MKKRADQQLFDLGFVESRSRARDLIKRGLVFSHGEKIKKPSEKISEEGIDIEEDSHYVSRGYLKLRGICEQIDISFTDKIVGDFGASTGGFTELALELGATKVFCVDVGTDQLHPRIKKDSRVIDLPNVNIKNGVELTEKINIAVIDLSFISLNLVMENIIKTLEKDALVLALIKPQFEVGKKNVDKNGIVKSAEASLTALKILVNNFQDLGLSIIKAEKCKVTGKAGNQEYFFYAINSENKKELDLSTLENL